MNDSSKMSTMDCIDDDADREGMIEPGQVPWFKDDEFDGYLWGKDRSVWVSLIISKAPKSGNLSRLFESILNSGRSIKVPTPFAHMRAILEHKGFSPTVEMVGDGETCEVWVKTP